MKFSKKIVQENLLQVELFAEKKAGPDKSANTGACKNNTTVNVGGCTN